MSAEFKKPSFTVTVGSSFWSVVDTKTSTTITYKPKVTEIPIIKTLGISPTTSELKVFASGIVYDHISLISGAEITLDAVALPTALVSELLGEESDGGAFVSRSNDIGKEFAFGYWSENSDGSYVYYWHPLCKLVAGEQSLETKTDEITEPSREYTITVLPFTQIWKFRYDTAEAIIAGNTPLTREEFFAKPILNISELPAETPIVVVAP